MGRYEYSRIYILIIFIFSISFAGGVSINDTIKARRMFVADSGSARLCSLKVVHRIHGSIDTADTAFKSGHAETADSASGIIGGNKLVYLSDYDSIAAIIALFPVHTEIITNGSMEFTIDNWTDNSTLPGYIYWANGNGGELVMNANGGTGPIVADQTITVVSGRKYKLEFYTYYLMGLTVKIGSTLGTSNMLNYVVPGAEGTSTIKHDTTFTATATTAYFRFSSTGSNLINHVSILPNTKSQVSLVVDKNDTIHSNLNIPVNVNLVDFTRGALLVPQANDTITINSIPYTGLGKIFDVTESGSKVKIVGTALPEWWGINGINDQLSINLALSSGAKKVYCGQLQYNIANVGVGAYPILLQSDCILQGAGREVTTLRLIDAQYCSIIGDGTSSAIRNKNIEVRNLKISGNSLNSGSSGSMGLSISNCDNFVIDNVWLDSINSYSLLLAYNSDVSNWPKNGKIINCKFTKSLRNAINLVGGEDILIEKNEFIDCGAQPQSAGYYCIFFEPSYPAYCRNIRIVNNSINQKVVAGGIMMRRATEDTANHGMYYDDTLRYRGILISGNVLDGYTSSAAITTVNFFNVNIAGNIIRGFAAGIEDLPLTTVNNYNLQIQNNIIKDCAGEAVTMCSYVNCQNNTISDCGLGIYNYRNHCTISGNHIFNNGKGVRDSGAIKPSMWHSGIYISDDGAYSTITDNKILDNQAIPSQNYGIVVQDTTNFKNCIIANNTFSGNIIAAVKVPDSSNIFAHNIGYVHAVNEDSINTRALRTQRAYAYDGSAVLSIWPGNGYWNVTSNTYLLSLIGNTLARVGTNNNETALQIYDTLTVSNNKLDINGKISLNHTHKTFYAKNPDTLFFDNEASSIFIIDSVNSASSWTVVLIGGSDGDYCEIISNSASSLEFKYYNTKYGWINWPLFNGGQIATVALRNYDGGWTVIMRY